MSSPATPPLSNEPWDEHLIRYGMPFAPRLVAKARGTLIWDSDGREILDFTSGQMCATIGHNHPRIVEAIRDACDGALHLFSGMLSPAVVALSQRLAAMLPPHLSRALFLSTGGESNEAALKLAKMHSGKFEIVGFTGAWHGMTSGAQAVNYVAGRKGYGPMVPGALTLPAPNAYHCPVRHCRDSCDGTCLEVGFDMVDAQSTGALAALIAEPVESSGGVIVSDEIEADCHAKGFIHPTSHVSDPLPAHAALAVLDVLAEEELNERALVMGDYLANGLRELQSRHEIIGDVRGFGLLQGVELVKDREARTPDAETGRAITARCMELGLSMNIVSVGAMSAIWRVAPPLTVTREEIDRALSILDEAIGDVLAQGTTEAAE